jgi:SOS-response transcriptional repressor LexA
MPKKNNTKMRILAYMAEYQQDHGYPPSIREIANAVGLKSTGSVHRHVRDLVNMGLLHQDEACKPLTVNKASTMNMQYLCLKAEDGTSIILACTEEKGKAVFNGTYYILGAKKMIMTGDIIACRDVSEDEVISMLA